MWYMRNKYILQIYHSRFHGTTYRDPEISNGVLFSELKNKNPPALKRNLSIFCWLQVLPLRITSPTETSTRCSQTQFTWLNIKNAIIPKFWQIWIQKNFRNLLVFPPNWSLACLNHIPPSWISTPTPTVSGVLHEFTVEIAEKINKKNKKNLHF